MSMIYENVKSYFDANGIRYEEVGGGDREALSVAYSGKVMESVRVVLIFDKDGGSVALRCFNIAKVPEDKLMAAYVALNELNGKFRWVKLHVDEDREITAEDDAVISPESAGAECLELIVRMIDIVDNNVYGEMMKLIWS